MARPAARSPEDYREAIMRAAEGVLAEAGPANTKMADIAQRAGVSYGTLYRHFADRDALLLAVLLEHTRLVERSWLRSAQESDPLERIVRLTTAPIVELDQGPELRDLFGSIQGAEQVIAGAQGEVARLNSLVVELLAAAVTEAQYLGWFAGLDRDAVVMTLAGIPLNYTLHTRPDPVGAWREVAADVEKVVRALAGPVRPPDPARA